MKISIIGAGRLGGALALALSQKGYEISQLISRPNKNAGKIVALIEPKPEIVPPEELEKINAEIVFITTPDPEIQKVAEQLSNKLNYKPFVFHTSGALSSQVLSSLEDVGCRIASVHPLVSVSDSQAGATRFKDSFFCVEGNPEACALAEKMVSDLGGKSFSIETEFKGLYHASAVMASGHLVALYSVAVESLTACGVTEKAAREILFPLVKSTVENLSAQTPAEALTGTFARADAETLKLHLQTLLGNVSPEVLAIYRQLGIRSLELARLQGANSQKLAVMRDLIEKQDS